MSGKPVGLSVDDDDVTGDSGQVVSCAWTTDGSSSGPGSSLTMDADSGTVFGFLEKKSVMGIPGLLSC